MHLKKISQTFCSVACNISLLLNSFLPYFAAVPAYAQEPDPTPIVESTPAPTPEVIVTETPVEPTTEPTAIPTIEPIVSPEPTAPAETAIPTEEPVVTPIVTVEPTSVPSENNNQSNSTPTPLSSPEPTAPAATVTPAPSFMVATGEIETVVVPNNTSRTDLLNPVMGTDKADYAPTEIAIIKGHGFSPNTEYKLKITSDGHESTFSIDETYSINTDSAGEFTYSYQLDGNYRPNYLVESFNLAGVLIASVTFTDAQLQHSICHRTSSNTNPYNQESPNIQNNGTLSGGHLDHNGPVYPSDNWGDIIPPYNYGSFSYPGKNWTTAGQAIYNNGCVIPLACEATRTYEKDGNFSNSEIDIVFQSGDQAISVSAKTGYKINRVWLEVSSDNQSGYYLYANGPLTNFNPNPGNDINWAKVEVEKVCGPVCGNGQVESGEQCDDGNKTNGDGCSSTCQTENATLIVKKHVINDNGGTKSAGNFTLKIGNTSFTGSESGTTFTIKSGSYSVTETVQADYAASYSSDCSGTIAAGVTKTCTVTNDDIAPKLKLVKIVDNKSVGSAIPSDWTLSAVGTSGFNDGGNSTTFHTVKAGETYLLSESTGPTGYTASWWTCNGGQASGNTVLLSLGETVTCTITNTKDTGTLKIVKQLNPTSDGGRFELKIDGSKYKDNAGNNSSTAIIDVNAGNHTVSETAESGSNLSDYESSISCTDGTQGVGNSLIVNVVKDEDVICTITNVKKSSIKVIKQSHPENTQNFIFTLSGVGSTELDDDNSGPRPNNHTFTKLTPGKYTLSENQVNGWYLDDISCTGATFTNKSIANRSIDITVTAGQNPVCTFDNYKYGSIRVCKIIIDGDRRVVNGSETPGSSFTINWSKGLNPTVINAGYTPNTRLLRSTPSDKKDAYCTTINNLKITNYGYSQEIISNSSIWQTPKYNDQYSETIQDLSDFYNYNSNTDSNGDINLALDPPGINRTLVILNQYKQGKINVTKYNDLNGNGTRDGAEPILPDWTINLSGETKVTNSNGSVTFDNLSPKNYTLSENITIGWSQTELTCSDVPTPPTGECSSDMDGDKVCDSSDNCPTVSNADQIDRNSNGVGDVCDAPITPTISQSETNCDDNIDNDGDGHTDSDDRDCEVDAFKLVKPVMAENNVDNDSYNHKYVRVSAGDNINCTIGNHLVIPTAEISKTNDAAGDLSPGSSVGYKIKVKILGNDVSNFKVTDLLSNGFKYRPGSYKVFKNISGVLTDVTTSLSIPEPQYHSPGVWDLKNLQAGDELELTYTADISTNQQPGTYYDLAWAKGQATYGTSGDVIATSESFADENFVGTQVPVVKSTQNSLSAGVEKEEVQGQVLGVSTELPYTGSNTIWLLISALMSIIGFTLMKKSSKKILTVLLLAGFLLFPSNVKAVDSISVRLEQPKSPINTNNVDINFVALDINQNPVVVKCFKKFSTDTSFTQFGADITSVNVGYNASHCSLSSVLSTEGTYQFYVTANGVKSNTVTMDYKTSGPGTPNDYRKDHPNNCDYKIHFKTADDSGKTVKVEVYRADITNFTANAGSLVSTVNVGSNEERDITNSVPDCSKNYYYVIRAFDNAGNGSGIVGDSVVKIVSGSTINTTTSTVNTGAIPVTGSNISPEATTSPTEQNGDATTNNGEGSVLGTQEFTKNFLQKYWLWLILLLVIIIRIIGYVTGKKKTSRR